MQAKNKQAIVRLGGPKRLGHRRQLTTYLPGAEYDQLEAIADRVGVSISRLVRETLLRQLSLKRSEWLGSERGYEGDDE